MHVCMCVCEWACAYVCVCVCGSACERGHIHNSRAPSTRICFHGRPCLAQKCEYLCQKPRIMIDLKNNIFFRIWQTWRGFRRCHVLLTTRCHTCEWVVAHTYTSHVIHTNGPRHTYKCVKLQLWFAITTCSTASPQKHVQGTETSHLTRSYIQTSHAWFLYICVRLV